MRSVLTCTVLIFYKNSILSWKCICGSNIYNQGGGREMEINLNKLACFHSLMFLNSTQPQICGSTTGTIVDMRSCQNMPNFYGWKSYDFPSEGKSYLLSDIHHYHKSQDLLGFRRSTNYEASILKHKICGSTTGAIVDMQTCQNMPNFCGWKSCDFLGREKLSPVRHTSLS